MDIKSIKQIERDASIHLVSSRLKSTLRVQGPGAMWFTAGIDLCYDIFLFIPITWHSWEVVDAMTSFTGWPGVQIMLISCFINLVLSKKGI